MNDHGDDGREDQDQDQGAGEASQEQTDDSMPLASPEIVTSKAEQPAVPPQMY
jgi:hypothetical protein